MKSLTKIRNTTNGFLYRNILKRIFFHFDPEIVHEEMIQLGHDLGKIGITRSMIGAMFATPELPELHQVIRGIEFKNPIGLSGGFDKNAILTDIIPALGFGFMEIGSVTAKPYEGNQGQRLWRLKKSQSLVVNYGLKSVGAKAIAESLKGKTFSIPVGVNIAKTNCAETNDLDIGIADYVETYKGFLEIASFFTINISCPNVAGGQPFHNSEWLEKLLMALEGVRTKSETGGSTERKPIFIKISPDLSRSEVDAIMEVASRHHVDGFVCTNLTKRRDLPSIIDPDVPAIGGLSGKVVEPLANELISYVYTHGKQKNGEKFIIVGAGGIFSARDAYQKIRAGATLLELITGMIFQGPQLISEIQLGLSKLLAKDGFKHLSEAIGADHRTTT